MRSRSKDWKRSSLQSTQVIDRRRAARDLAASLAAQGDTAAASLERRLATVLEEGEEMPDVRLLLRLLERLVTRAGEELEEADGDRYVRAMRLKAVQEETRETRGELHGEVVRVRKALVDLYGSARVRRRFGLGERTPRGIADLAEEGRRLAAFLADEELALPASPAGLESDPRGWARSLAPPAARLDRLLKELERRRVGAGDGVLELRRTLDACAETYLLVARTAEALFRLGGEQELARRLRPKVKRSRRRAGTVRAAASWWRAAVAVFRRLRGMIVRGVEAAKNRADLAKTRAFPLSRGSKKPPDP